MSNIRYIDKTYIESPDFQEPQEDLTLRINLSSGQELLFTAEKEFYTPRRISTNLADVVQLENVVEYSPNNVAIVKLQNGQTSLTTPQYYLNSIVRDIYKQYPLDTFFTELDDDLAVPEYVGTDFEKRQLALNTLLNLEDLAVGAAVNDPTLIAQATDDIDNNFSELAGLDMVMELGPGEITTPEEDDQLTSLDFVGLTDNGSSTTGGYVSSPNVGAFIPGLDSTGVSPGDTKIILPNGDVVIASGDPLSEITEQQQEEESVVPDQTGLFSSDDTSSDIIDPVPVVDETGLIRMDGGLPTIAGEIPGLETVNRAIELLNTGTQQIESSMQVTTTPPQDDCKTITIAKGKKGFAGRFGIGRKPERKVSRSSIENKLALVKTDIAQQENSTEPLLKTASGTPTLIKTQKFSLFSKLASTLGRAGVLNAISRTVGAPVQITSTTAAVPSGYQPMTKQQILNLLYKTKTELETILAQGC